VRTPKKGRKPIPLDVVVGRAIRHLRKKRDWSQQVLASRLGISLERVREHESGARPMRPRMLLRMATVLEVPLSAFFRNYRRRPLGTMAMAAATYSRHRPGAAAMPPAG
jgi:transcriptional regulator with XRE-family HTH domain